MANNRRTVFVHVGQIHVNPKKLRKLSDRKITQYLCDYDRGDVFPPISVDDNGDFYTIWDGRHRYQAQLMAGQEYVEVEIR